MAKDGYTGAYLQHQLVRICWLVGEPEKALDRFEPLLKIPYTPSPGWLRIDPTFTAKGQPTVRKTDRWRLSAAVAKTNPVSFVVADQQ